MACNSCGSTLVSLLSRSVDSPGGFLCNPSTGVPIFVRYQYSFINGQQTTIVLDAWNLDGTLYTGDKTLLISCAAGSLPTNINLQKVNGAFVSLGQQVKATSLPVTLASDQGALAVTQASTSAIANFNYGSLAFGAVSGAYATLITNAQNAKLLDVYNGLDQDVILSTNAVNSHIYVPKSTGKVIGLEANKMFINTNISVKSVSAVGSGSIIGTLMY